MKNKNILFVEFLTYTAANHLLMMLQGLAKHHNGTLVVLCQKSSPLSQHLNGTNIAIYEIDYVDFRVDTFATYIPFIRQLLTMTYIIVKHKIHIIHCHRLNWAYLCIIPSLLFRIPLFVHIVIVEKLTSRFQNTLLHLHKGIRYVAVSKNALTQFKKLYPNDVHIGAHHYGGLYFPEMERWRNTPLAVFEKHYPRHTKIIAMVSRMDPLKGVDIFIEAAALLSEKYSDVRFVHIGNHNAFVWGRYYEDCKRQVDHLGLSKKFTFLNYFDEILASYKYFHICVLPTRKDALSYVNLEANYFGKPVIFTDVDGLMETSNPKFGLHIPNPPSAILLFRKLDWLLTDVKAYNRLTHLVRLPILKKFNAEQNAMLLENRYTEL